MLFNTVRSGDLLAGFYLRVPPRSIRLRRNHATRGSVHFFSHLCQVHGKLTIRISVPIIIVAKPGNTSQIDHKRSPRCLSMTFLWNENLRYSMV